MKQIFIISSFILSILVSGCATNSIYRSNTHKGYHTYEIIFHGDKKRAPFIQIGVLTKVSKKSKEYFEIKDVYNYKQNSIFFYKRSGSEKQKNLKLFVGIDSSDAGTKLSDQDIIIIDRFKFLADSLQWPAINNWSAIRGFNEVDPKKIK